MRAVRLRESGRISAKSSFSCSRPATGCCFFVENPYKVLSRKDIIDHVWFVASIKEGTVDVHIASLRETLKPLKKSLAIETVRGVGFRLSAVADIPQVQPQTQQAVESIASPATPQPPKSPQSPQSPRPVERRRVPDDRPRAGGAPHQPVFASNLGAAVEKIRPSSGAAAKRDRGKPAAARCNGSGAPGEQAIATRGPPENTHLHLSLTPDARAFLRRHRRIDVSPRHTRSLNCLPLNA